MLRGKDSKINRNKKSNIFFRNRETYKLNLIMTLHLKKITLKESKLSF